ncbi:hypothetical protein CN602_29195, partial [Bacillus cereus]|uniref:hypothetical protein n=1 Tax=Bacillus cereus TaxID=1396 RepID=UPI000BF1B3E7
MIKTLLAGTVLSTGLLANGALGTEDLKLDQKMETYKQCEMMKMSNKTGTKPAEKSYTDKEAQPAEKSHTDKEAQPAEKSHTDK